MIRYANYAKKNKDARPIYRLISATIFTMLKNASGYTQENYQNQFADLGLCQKRKDIIQIQYLFDHFDRTGSQNEINEYIYFHRDQKAR